MKTISLAIPKPCSEKWENFTATSTGRFCGSCSKVVIDFTKKTDAEIFAYFQDKPSHACGRFHPTQLANYSTMPPLMVTPGLTLLKAGFLSMLFLLVSKQTIAQDVTPKTKSGIVYKPGSPTPTQEVGDPEQILMGLVVTEDNEPLAGANIILKGATIGTVADADARFQFPQKVKEGDVLVVYFIGFDPVEHTVRKKTSDALTIRMVCDYSIMGEVAVDSVYTNPSAFRRAWQKVKQLF